MMRTADRDHCSRGERGRFDSLYERSRCHSREINSATGPRRSLCSGRGYPYTRLWEVHLMGRQSHIVRNTVRGKIPDWLRRRSEAISEILRLYASRNPIDRPDFNPINKIWKCSPFLHEFIVITSVKNLNNRRDLPLCVFLSRQNLQFPIAPRIQLVINMGSRIRIGLRRRAPSRESRDRFSGAKMTRTPVWYHRRFGSPREPHEISVSHSRIFP